MGNLQKLVAQYVALVQKRLIVTCKLLLFEIIFVSWCLYYQGRTSNYTDPDIIRFVMLSGKMSGFLSQYRCCGHLSKIELSIRWFFVWSSFVFHKDSHVDGSYPGKSVSAIGPKEILIFDRLNFPALWPRKLISNYPAGNSVFMYEETCTRPKFILLIMHIEKESFFLFINPVRNVVIILLLRFGESGPGKPPFGELTLSSETWKSLPCGLSPA